MKVKYRSDNQDEGGESLLPIEKKAKKLRAKQKVDKKLAEEELDMNIKQTEIYKLPSGQDISKDSHLAPDLEVLKQRIKDIMQVRIYQIVSIDRMRSVNPS